MSAVRTGRGFERLITFADAVVAIALTLLVLPLVEITVQVRQGESVGRVLADHRDQVTDRDRGVAQTERHVAGGPDDADGDGDPCQDDGEPTEPVLAHAAV